MHTLIASLRALVALTLLTGVAYPLGVTMIAQAVFPRQADGSLVERDGVVIGSELLAQKFSAPGSFHPRPSAADYATMPSGAGNQGFTSRKLRDEVAGRRSALGSAAPADLLTASGSGLDPDISPAGARFQAARVAAARGLAPEVVLRLVEENITPPQWGFLGQPRVNVLTLNLKLDAARQ